MWDMHWAGHDIIRERVQTYAIDCDLKWGYLDVAIKPRHLQEQQLELEKLDHYGFPRPPGPAERPSGARRISRQ